MDTIKYEIESCRQVILAVGKCLKRWPDMAELCHEIIEHERKESRMLFGELVTLKRVRKNEERLAET